MMCVVTGYVTKYDTDQIIIQKHWEETIQLGLCVYAKPLHPTSIFDNDW